MSGNGERSEGETQIDRTVSELLQELQALRQRVALLEATLGDHEGRLGQVTLVLAGHGGRLDELEAKVEGVSATLVAHQEREGRHGP
jgi:septal ring factor EnvC (AmiA/AmiB activator)